MVQQPPSPRVLLSRWLAQLQNPASAPNWIRRIETRSTTIRRTDNGKYLCGFEVAEGLYLTRQRSFYQVKGNKAAPISLEEVAANFNLQSMQAKYREATESWKNGQRRRTG